MRLGVPRCSTRVQQLSNRHRRCSGGDTFSLHLLRQPHRFLDQGLHDHRFRDGLDDLAPDEDLALAVAAGHAQIGLAGLPRAVDDAAHHRDPQGHGHSLQTGSDLVGEPVDVDLRAAARRSRHDLEPALAQVQGLEDRQSDLHLFHRRRGQRDPDGVADPLAQQGSEGDRRLDRALECRAGLGDAEVQRVVALLGQLLVGADHDHRIVVLDRDLEIAEAVFLEQRRLVQRGLDQRLGRGFAVLGQQALVERARVDADAQRHARVACGPRDLAHLVVERLDVAGVDPNGGTAGVDGREDVLGLEVDVGDHRDLRLPGDGGQRVRVVLRRDGHPDDVAAGRGELGDLLQGRVDVRGERRRHRLDRDLGIAPDGDGPDLDLAGFTTWRQHGRRRGDGAERWHADGYGCRSHIPNYPLLHRVVSSQIACSSLFARAAITRHSRRAITAAWPVPSASTCSPQPRRTTPMS